MLLVVTVVAAAGAGPHQGPSGGRRGEIGLCIMLTLFCFVRVLWVVVVVVLVVAAAAAAAAAAADDDDDDDDDDDARAGPHQRPSGGR